MSTTSTPIHYGDFVGICQVCFKDNHRFGTLVDPNGHTWLVCKNCINKLWQDAQAILQEDHQDKIEAAIDVLRKALKKEG